MSRSAALTWPLSRSGARKREEQTNRPSAILVQAPRIDVPEAREVQRKREKAALDVQEDGLYLYRHIFPPGVADLAFCGSEVATISNIVTHGIHAE